jgi:hypothetical protein
MSRHHRIGTFRITRVHDQILVRDADKFNNWGRRYFLDMPTALAWARLAQARKAGPTLQSRPVWSLAA